MPLALTVCQYSPEQLKKKGAPIDWFAIEPAVAISDTMPVMKKAAHRHAALLFYDYLLSEEGNRLIARFGYAPTCRQRLNTPLSKIRVKLLDLQRRPTNRPNPAHYSTQSLPGVAAVAKLRCRKPPDVETEQNKPMRSLFFWLLITLTMPALVSAQNGSLPAAERGQLQYHKHMCFTCHGSAATAASAPADRRLPPTGGRWKR